MHKKAGHIEEREAFWLVNAFLFFIFITCTSKAPRQLKMGTALASVAARVTITSRHAVRTNAFLLHERALGCLRTFVCLF